MVDIQVVSDLHLEFPEHYDIFNITRKAPHLALLGDIGYLKKHEESYLDFLRRHLVRFETVFLVLGNHEPWHSTWASTKEVARRFESQIREERKHTTNDMEHLGEFVLLDQTRYDFPPPPSSSPSLEEKQTEVTILGCTLFSRVPPESLETVSFGIGDFYHTADWTVEQHNSEFESDLAWLNKQVQALEAEAQAQEGQERQGGGEEEEEEEEESAGGGKKRRIAIFTHHNPTLDPRTVDPKFRGDVSRLQSGFATDLTGEPCWESPEINVWAFGHTHFNCDFVLGGDGEQGGKRVLANQRGYYSRKAGGFEDEGGIVRLCEL